MYDKFQGCTVDVQVATMILINPRENPVLCTRALKVGHYVVHYDIVMDTEGFRLVQ